MNVLTDKEAATLRKIEKYLTNPRGVDIPQGGETKLFPLHYDANGKRLDNMRISSYRGKRNARKVSYRLLYNGNIRLVRIDTQDATPHINPDKTRIESYEPHIHLYDERYGDRYAYALPPEFGDAEDIAELFLKFLEYSNVVNADDVHIIEQEVLLDAE